MRMDAAAGTHPKDAGVAPASPLPILIERLAMENPKRDGAMNSLPETVREYAAAESGFAPLLEDEFVSRGDQAAVRRARFGLPGSDRLHLTGRNLLARPLPSRWVFGKGQIGHLSTAPRSPLGPKPRFVVNLALRRCSANDRGGKASDAPRR